MSSRLCAVSPIAAAVDGPEVILPCQYYDLAGGGERQSGEQRLMFALLVDAINVFQRGMMSSESKARRLSIEAEQWIMTQRPTAGLTFDLVCEAVGIPPRLLRRRLLAWKHTLCHRYNRQACLHLTSVPRVHSPIRRPGRPRRMPVTLM